MKPILLLALVSCWPLCAADAHITPEERTKVMNWLEESHREFLAAIHTPILLASAGIEGFVEPAAHRLAARLLPDCTLVEFPDSKHEPFLERDPIRNRWLDAIDRFVAERLASKPAAAPVIEPELAP